MRTIQTKRRHSALGRALFVMFTALFLFLGSLSLLTEQWQTQGVHSEPSLYHTYEELVTELQEREQNHSFIVKLHNLTTTFEGRTVWAVKVSDDPKTDDPSEPDVLFVGGQKANSLISVEIALYLLAYLTDNYGTDDAVTELVNSREIWILPLLNPDGHAYIDNDTSGWKKNRRDNGDTFGVNLNRNYGFNWGVDEHTSDESVDQNYHGPAPFSEPETQALKSLVEAHSFVFSLSFTSPGKVITYPWGYSNESAPNGVLLHEIASDLAMYSGYDVSQGAKYFLHHGNMDDWLYNNSNVLPFTFYVGDQNIPQENQIQPTAERHIPACVYLLDIADDPTRANAAQWTFMVYMGGDNDLETEGILDFNEMEKVGSNPYVNIIVQFDRAAGHDDTNGNWKDTRRYLVTRDYDEDIIHSTLVGSIDEANMASSQTLVEFVNWSITNYPAERYFLDLWGHGKGWLGVTSDSYSGDDWLTMDEIKVALPKFKDRIDVVGFDNCNMAMIEVYTLFLGHADYIVGSEKEEDAWGWPYDMIFEDLTADPYTSPEDLSRIIAEFYVDWASAGNSKYSATSSVVDMSRFQDLLNTTDTLAWELNRTMALYWNEID
ncbi:MAG: hypothetical protein JSW28_09450, partial [Thermoplasmata archaeon]